MIRVYAFAAGLSEAPRLDGIGGNPLETVAVADIAAVVSDDGGRGAAAEADVVRHGEVVDALSSRAHAVLPARFGETFPDRDALVAAATRRLDELRERLDFVRGHAEVTVRIRRRADGDPEPVGEGGAAYMLERLRARDSELDAIDAELRAMSRDVVAHRGLDGMYRASFLVRQEDVRAFAERLDRLVEGRPELTAVCTGPWPAYSFAEAS